MELGTALTALGILFVLAIIIFFAAIIWSVVFWILMLVDCAKRKFKEPNTQIVWVLIIIFTGLIGALIYYFIIKKPNAH
jgi:NADH:ubiquinone oxidoreductase subunit 6 (subunit J)